MSAVVERLSTRLDEVEAKVRMHEQRYAGDSPLAFLAPDARKALGDRLRVLNLNFCKLAVDSLAERIRVAGFLVDGSSDAALWQTWREQEMESGSLQAITEALLCGRGFISVWGNSEGPVINAEAASQCLVERDPMTREVVRGFKRWTDSGKAHAILYEPDVITPYTSHSNVPEGGVVPSTGWVAGKAIPNPLGMVPLIQLTNRGRIADVLGVSEMDAIKDANDALTKTLVDSLVTSEYFARPRRWATGVEVEEDENGNAVDPFANSDRTWVVEDPGAKLGQFPTSDLAAYDGMTRTLLGQISALSGLPAHYLFADQQPSSGEEVRAKEISLVARAESKIVMLTHPLAHVARLAVAVRDGRDPRRVRAEVSWADPATRTLAQEADAVVKLAQGDRPVLPISEARARLGYSPEQVRQLERQDASEAALRMVSGL